MIIGKNSEKGGWIMENKLTCGATGCVNNIGNYCTARYIDIDIKQVDKNKFTTFCNTFGERNLKEALREAGNVNFGGAIHQALDNSDIYMSPFINCLAYKCVHNDNGRCEAKNILINSFNGDGTEPYCETYK